MLKAGVMAAAICHQNDVFNKKNAAKQTDAKLLNCCVLHVKQCKQCSK